MPDQNPKLPLHFIKPRRQDAFDSITAFFRGYFWFIFKNVMGWLLIVSAFPIGVVVPGPGGIPIFLIGFALVTFPGKRRLTSRVMSGRGLALDASIFTFLTAFLSIGVTCTLMWIVSDRYKRILDYFNVHLTENDPNLMSVGVALVGVGLIALLITWAVTRIGLQILNFFLSRAPKIRRMIRPWLRKRGINVLPARRKNRTVAGENEEILEFSEEHQTRLRNAWNFLKPWLRRAFSVGITIFIIRKMLLPLKASWPVVREHLHEVSIFAFIVAVMMFAFFLFAFRALVWRRILKTFGHKLPVAPAVRIWSTSELARYLPGAIWQVVGRVFLVRPYGVSGSICSTTQVLELCVFLLANVLVAVTCAFYFTAKEFAQLRNWMFAAMGLVPLLALLLHPKVFYTIVNAALRRAKKPEIVKRLRGKNLVELLGWTILGLAWQGLAVFLIMRPVFGLKLDWLWMVTGAYCLAWCSGFLAFWAPAGLGVREYVFVMAMQVAMPESIKNSPQFSDPNVRAGLLAMVSFFLRLWTLLGELLLTTIIYVFDVRGALGHSDAPGRLPLIAEPVDLPEQTVPSSDDASDKRS